MSASQLPVLADNFALYAENFTSKGSGDASSQPLPGLHLTLEQSPDLLPPALLFDICSVPDSIFIEMSGVHIVDLDLGLKDTLLLENRAAFLPRLVELGCPQLPPPQLPGHHKRIFPALGAPLI